jgi:hypothetical protein
MTCMDCHDPRHPVQAQLITHSVGNKLTRFRCHPEQRGPLCLAA